MMILVSIVVSQKTPVWFLTLSFGHPVTRNCYIPENTALLATLLNSECSYAEYANLTNESELRDCAKEQQDHVVSPTARINDIEIPNLEDYRIQSGLFNITLPANNILDLPAQTTQAVSDGNWLFLKPLPEGTYNLILKGNIDDNINNDTENGSPLAFAGPIGWNYTTTHILTVKQKRASHKRMNPIPLLKCFATSTSSSTTTTTNDKNPVQY